MKRTGLILLLMLMVGPLWAVNFPTNTSTVTLDTEITKSTTGFSDFAFKWRGWESQRVTFTIESNATALDISSYSALFKANKMNEYGSNVNFIAKEVADITTTSAGLAWFTVAHTNIPPDDTYLAELLLLSNTSTNSVRSLGRGTIQVVESLFDDEDDAWTPPVTTSLVSYLTIAGAATSYLALDASNDPITGALDVDSTMTVQDVVVQTNCTVAGTLQAEHLYSTDDFVVGDDATISGDVTVVGIVQAEHIYSTDDAVIADDLTVTGTVIVVADVQAEHLYSTDDAVIADDLTVTGNVTVVATVQAEHLYSTDDLVVADDLTVTGTVDITDQTTMRSRLTMVSTDLVVDDVDDATLRLDHGTVGENSLLRFYQAGAAKGYIKYTTATPSTDDIMTWSVGGSNPMTLDHDTLTIAGTATATTFSGSGASLTSIPAGQLTGNIASARMTNALSGGAISEIVLTGGGIVLDIDGEIHQNFAATNASGVHELTSIDVVVNIEGSGSGVDFHAVDVAEAGSGSANIVGLGTHVGVSPLHQHIGTFAAPAAAYALNGSGNTTDVTTAFGATATDIGIFSNDNDYVWIGAAATFDEIEVMLDTVASASIFSPATQTKFFYATNDEVYVQFYPADDTDGFQQEGTIRFESSLLTGWTTTTLFGGASTNYWIAIQRTRNSMGTVPVEDTIKVLTATEYFWDENGDITCNTISNNSVVATTLAGNGSNVTEVDAATVDSLEGASFGQVSGDTYTGAMLLDDDASLQMEATADGMADDKYNGITITGLNAGEAITQWDCVFLQSDAKFDQADANASGEFPAWGLACNATGDGTNLVVLTRGVVRNEGWSGLTVAGPVYLSTTAGGLTQTIPSASGDCIQIIGFAISDSEILFDFSRPYQELE